MKRLDPWLELQFSIGAAIRDDMRPSKSLLYIAQRARPLIRNTARTDEERVILASLNALREAAMMWVECDDELLELTHQTVKLLAAIVDQFRADVVAAAVANCEALRVERDRASRERRAS